MRLVALALVPLLCAGAAFAQVEPGCEQGSSKANKGFVDNYNVATASLSARSWTAAIDAAALARPYVLTGRQEEALIQIEVAAYHGAGNEAAMVERIEAYLALPCTPPAIRKNYQSMLDKARTTAPAPQ